MADTVVSALVAAGAALIGSSLTGVITLLGIQVKSNSDRQDLSKRLEHETAAAHDSREQERRQRAYISLLTHINLLRYFMNINFNVVQREFNAVTAVRDAEGQANPGSAAEQAALDLAGPNDEEKEALATGPSLKERAETLALVYGLASDQVRQQFEVLTRMDKDLSKEMRKIRITLRRKGSSTESSADNRKLSPAAEAAVAKLHQAADAAIASLDVLKAFRTISDTLGPFNAAVDKLEEMVRAELQSALTVVDRSSASAE